MDESLPLFLMLFVGLVIGGSIGWGLTWLYAKAGRARIEARLDADEEKLDWLADARNTLRETFEALASKSLRENARDFAGRIGQGLSQHTQHIATLKTELEKNLGLNLTAHFQRIDVVKVQLEKNISQLDGEIRDMEQKREGAYHSLRQQVFEMQKTQIHLQQTTQQLLVALKSGPVRGRWGEIQLRKIVELAGMTEHISFGEQVSGQSGGIADAVVHLPNEGRIPLDSKFPLKAFLEAIESADEEIRRAKVAEHVRAIRDQIKELSRKAYWRDCDPSPELTIMFVPIESCLMIAFEHDPEIIEFALSHKIILASPVTLLGFLKSIAYGWQQFTINKNARKILTQGKELYSRIDIWMDYHRKTGERIAALAKSYNESVASLQSRFLPSCRKFQELTALADEISEIEPVSIGVSLPNATEERGSENDRSSAPERSATASGVCGEDEVS